MDKCVFASVDEPTFVLSYWAYITCKQTNSNIRLSKEIHNLALKLLMTRFFLIHVLLPAGSGGSSSSGCADLDSIGSGDSQQNSGAAPN